MKRLALVICAALGIFLNSRGEVHAWGCGLCYGGQQPCWNVLNCKNRHYSCEEQRLNRFWHDYYDALRKYYCLVEKIDWVAYYKNHGYQINGCCAGPNGCPMINYAPVVVTPGMQWAVPPSCMGGPPAAGACGPYGHPGFGY